MKNTTTIDQLLAQGVKIPAPDAVCIADDVIPAGISPGAVVMPGSRISGADTVIGEGSVIGAEGPATVANCQIARHVTLGSGYFEGSVFLDGSSMGGSSHVRPGCLIEEQASGAHSVGLKQTVLLPYVTLGSLINFCDCLMAGGTSRRNHSEVGSSYIHFNFTPNQDKATPSLIGDVVHGVLLDQSPIFLGGQGGMVGPVRVAYGSVIPAGRIVRRDIVKPDQIVVQEPLDVVAKDFDPGVYNSSRYLVRNNFTYIAHIQALKRWYEHVRLSFAGDANTAACYKGAVNVLNKILDERVKRLGAVAGKFETSAERLMERGDEDSVSRASLQKAFADRWPEIRKQMEAVLGREPENEPALEAIRQAAASRDPSQHYLEWIHGLDSEQKQRIVDWLGGMTTEIEALGVV